MKRRLLFRGVTAVLAVVAVFTGFRGIPGCSTAGEKPKSLESLGFERIEGTAFHRYRQLVVLKQDDGSLVYFSSVPQSSGRLPEQIRRLGIGSPPEDTRTDWLFFGYPDASELRTPGGSGGAGVRPVELRVTDDLSPRGLGRIGFERSAYPGLLERGLKNPRRSPEMAYLLLDKGRIKAVLGKLGDRGVPFAKDSRIVGTGTMDRDEYVFVRSDKRKIAIALSPLSAEVAGWHYLEEPTLAELGIFPVSQIREASGFVVGGRNETEIVRGLKSLNGQSIARLEANMRSAAATELTSLAEGESLVEVLASDNRFVLGQKLTHQRLALPLKVALAIGSVSPNGKADFTHGGRSFQVTLRGFRGAVMSPFKDDSASSAVVEVTNRDTKKTLRFFGLLPGMIERYGFYQGRIRGRVEPRDIVETFGLR